MENEVLFFKKLFLPFTCLFVLLEIASFISIQIGSCLQAQMTHEKALSSLFILWTSLKSVLVFALAIFLCKRLSFKKLFSITLATCVLTLAGCVYSPLTPTLSYLLFWLLHPKLLIFLSWEYINQIATLSFGKKYYFAFNAMSCLSIVLLSIFPLPSITRLDLFSYQQSLFAITAACLILAWGCDRWIQSQILRHMTLKEATSSSCSFNLMPIIGFAFLLKGFTLAANLNSFSFFQKIKMFSPSVIESSRFLANHMMVVWIGILPFFLSTIFIGPRLLGFLGWKKSTLLALFLGVVSMIVWQISPPSFINTFSQIIFRSINFAWMIPITQIALLAYPKQERFFIHAYAFLVVAPLLEIIQNHFQIDSLIASIASLTLFGIMATITLLLAKPKQI